MDRIVDSRELITNESMLGFSKLTKQILHLVDREGFPNSLTKERLRRRKGPPADPKNVQYSVDEKGDSIKIWGCISSNGLGPFVTRDLPRLVFSISIVLHKKNHTNIHISVRLYLSIPSIFAGNVENSVFWGFKMESDVTKKVDLGFNASITVNESILIESNSIIDESYPPL